jgi:ribosomal protein S12 methylthiotransferase
LSRLRGQIPDLVLRTTFITGFPSETEDQFAELNDFIIDQRFEHVGVFTYSYEADTPSARLDGHLSEQIKEERRGRLMETQQAIAFEWNETQIGRQVDVIVDTALPGEQDAYVGRSYAQAPDVDGVVYVTGQSLRPGDLLPTEIVAVSDYDLVAAAV